MAAAQRILVTGSSGHCGVLLVPRMRRSGRTLRLLDVRPPDPTILTDADEVVQASITDLDAMTRACQDVDAIVHLGGQAVEATIDDVLRLNVYGTYCVLEAAHRAGVPRVLIASSHHAAGFHDRPTHPGGDLPGDVHGRPDTFYGWSKLAAESAGRLYVDRYGMDIVCIRIGAWAAAPRRLRDLALWLSPDDATRLVDACLTAPSPGFGIVWGISRNTRRWFSLAEGEALGYHPHDDAETYAPELIAEHGDLVDDPYADRVGGPWCAIPLGEPFRAIGDRQAR